MTEKRYEGVAKKSTEMKTVSKNDQKLIDSYLKEVEKHLHGFSREAKDSILIEIREHIMGRMQEEPGRDDGTGGRAGRGKDREWGTGGGKEGRVMVSFCRTMDPLS